MKTMLEMDKYRSIVENIMSYSVKSCPGLPNPVRELAGNVSSPSSEHWRAPEISLLAKKPERREQRLMHRCPRDI